MRNLVLQVQIEKDKNVLGNCHLYIKDLYRCSMESAKRYALKTGADYFRVTDHSYIPTRSAAFQKFKLFDFHDYDYVLYIDSDAIVSEECPNIFDQSISGLAAVPDFDIRYKQHSLWEQCVIKRLALKNLKPNGCRLEKIKKRYYLENGN